jgi:tRNA (guanine-N7-)-methyltransferase
MALTPEFAERLATRLAALRVELEMLLPQPREVVLELGCGHGHFLARYATEFPAKFCVGVDFSSDRIARAQRKARRAGLPNCHFIRAEAREFLSVLPEGVTFGEIWVLFPDPWPKKRHHKNRLLQAGFLAALAPRAGEGTRLYFRTDHAGYFHTVDALLPDLPAWRLDPAARWPLEPETVFQARAPAYESLVAVRTSDPARPAETTGPRPPPRAGPT